MYDEIDLKKIYEQPLEKLQTIWKVVVDETRDHLKQNPDKIKIPSFGRKNFVIDKKRFFHSATELFVQLSGVTAFDLPGEKFVLEAGEVALIPTYMPHAEAVVPEKGQFCTMVISFHDPIIGIHFGKANKKNIPDPGSEWGMVKAPEGRKIVVGIEELFRFFDSSTGRVPAEVKFESIDMLLAYLSEVSTKNLESGTNFSPLITKCTEYVRRNLKDPTLEVKTLADLCGVTPNHLSARFVKEYNIRLTEYINLKRLQKAAQLLEDTTLSISEISWACGYWSANYLSRLFKAKYGMTPRVYRKKMVEERTLID